MRIPKESLSGEDIRQTVEELLITHLKKLDKQGYKCEGRLVANILVAAAIHGRTIESVCEDLTVGVESNTIRQYLKAQLKGLCRKKRIVLEKSGFAFRNWKS